MPVGTLLYRTSRDGEMYGYNTKNLFELLDFSLAKGLETVKVNCGHVGMYVGKIDGEDMVLEAIDNGVQLTPAKYFVNTGEGEKLVGAKIPKDFEENKAAIQRLTSIIKLVEKVGFTLGIVFVFIGIMITFNAIRLTMYAHKHEFEVMRLVGASNIYIRMPFVFEGLFYGVASAFLVMIFSQIVVKLISYPFFIYYSLI